MKEPTEFEHKGQRYQIKRIDAIGQAILAQKLSPLVMPIMRVLAKRSIEQGATDALALLNDFEVVAGALESVPAETMREIYDVCLSRLMRQAAKDRGWQRLTTADGQLMYDDLEGFDIVYLSFAVIKDQMGSFLADAMAALGMNAAA